MNWCWGSNSMEPLACLHTDAAALIRQHRPRWHHPHKQQVYEIACAAGEPWAGTVTYARWAAAPLPVTVTARSRFTIARGVFAYAPPAPGTVDWHLNFADPQLFFAYTSALMAQDEIQVAEHPALGALREALAATGPAPRTVAEDGKPTPVTVTGVQRRCAINTDGLYGNAFARATPAQVKAATLPLVPPTVSNILALAAPGYGSGAYTREEIAYVVSAAYTGFAAARQESTRLTGPARTVIHTGFWGCGAFGGNRTLMTILQALAADLADVDVVFWAFDTAGVQLAEQAQARYERLRDQHESVGALLERVFREGFLWGVADGN